MKFAFLFFWIAFHAYSAVANECPDVNRHPRAEAVTPEKSLWGFVDDKQEWVIKPAYQAARVFCNGLAAVKKEGQWGFIDPFNNLVVEPRYLSVNDFSEAFAVVSNEKGWVYIDRKGQVRSPSFLSANSLVFGKGLVTFLDDDGQRVFNVVSKMNEFKPLFKQNYPDIKILNRNVVAVKEEKQWGLRNDDDTAPTDETFSDVTATSSPFVVAFSANGRKGFINTKTKKMVPAKFVGFRNFVFAPNLLIVEGDERWAVLDENLDLATGFLIVDPKIPCPAEEAARPPLVIDRLAKTPFYHDIALFPSHGGSIYINNKGKAISGTYVSAEPFSEDTGLVKVKQHYGYITPENKWAIAPRFTFARPFRGGFARTETVTAELESATALATNGFPPSGLNQRRYYCSGKREIIDHDGKAVTLINEVKKFDFYFESAGAEASLDRCVEEFRRQY